MFELLNEMLELIYIADVKTYELLFMNTIGCERFNIKKVDGQKCYKVLQGFDEPCSFCNNAMLKFDETYSWSITNELTNCHYLLKDKLIDWNGRTARIEIAFDDTESENEKIALKNALEGEKMVMECTKQLYRMEDSAPVINNVLEQIGTFLKAERTYIFDIRGNEMFNTFEWCAPDVLPQKDKLQNLDISLIDNWMPIFNKQECVVLNSLDDFEWTNENSKRVLAEQGIKQLVVSPLEKDGKIVGYFGADNPSQDKTVNITSLFSTLSFFLMTTMRRAEDEEQLARLSYYDMLTGFYNRNRFMQDISQMTNYDGAIGVAYLDINGLKAINDSFGHTRGDEVLLLCAQKTAEAFGVGDFYRIGGDEFLVICKSISERKFIQLAEKAKLEFEIDPQCRAAIGYQWSDSEGDIQNLIAKADVMMYKEKKLFYSNVVEFDRRERCSFRVY